MAGMRDDSAGKYGQWTNDPNQSWGDYLKMLGMDAGEGAYNALANITGGLSPIGTSPEGNMALQVPPMVSGLYDSAKRIGERGGFTRVEEFDAPLKQDLANALLTFYGGNALAGVAKRPPGSVGMFAGVKAKTADHAALAKAEELAGQGIPREQIWNDTGWFKGADDNWRFEIDDSKATFPGKDYLRHPGLYDAYESLGDAKILRTGRKDEGAYAPGFGPMPDRVLIGPDSGNPRSIALHEFQHGIQNREGFAKGGTPERSPKQLVDQEARRLYEAAKGRQASGVKSESDRLYEDLFGTEQTYTKSWDELPLREQLEWYDPARENIYHRLAGEVEARNVETRRDMTPDERRARPPWLDYDVPESNQIVRFGEAGPQMSAGVAKPRGALGAGVMRDAGGLPMDQASRMARAKEMGFDTDRILNHTTTAAPFDEFKLPEYADGRVHAVYASPNKSWEKFIDTGNGQAHTRELLAKTDKPFLWDGNNMEDTARRIREIYPEWEGGFYGGVNAQGKDAGHTMRMSYGMADALKANGYDSLHAFRSGNALDDEWAFLYPEKLRDVNAAFDPARAGENGLLLSDNKPSIPGAALATAGEQPSILGKIPSAFDQDIQSAGSFQPPGVYKMNALEALLHSKVMNAPGAQRMRGGEMVEVPPLNDLATASEALSPYDISALDKAWRNKTRQTGELFSDNKPSIFGAALATAGEQQPIRAYRGATNAGNIARDDASILWGSSSPEVASTYARPHFTNYDIEGAVAPLDMDFRNPLTVDANGKHWAELEHGGQRYTADDLANLAKSQGHDGLIVKNVMDTKSWYPGEPRTMPADTYVALQRGTVKSPLTGEILFSRGVPLPPQQDDNLPDWLKF